MGPVLGARALVDGVCHRPSGDLQLCATTVSSGAPAGLIRHYTKSDNYMPGRLGEIQETVAAIYFAGWQSILPKWSLSSQPDGRKSWERLIAAAYQSTVSSVSSYDIGRDPNHPSDAEQPHEACARSDVGRARKADVEPNSRFACCGVDCQARRHIEPFGTCPKLSRSFMISIKRTDPDVSEPTLTLPDPRSALNQTHKRHRQAADA